MHITLKVITCANSTDFSFPSSTLSVYTAYCK